MDNGHQGEVVELPDRHYARLILTLDVVPEWHLHIAGQLPAHDVALAILAQAQRYFEARLRAEQVKQLQELAARAQQDAALLSNLNLKGR